MKIQTALLPHKHVRFAGSLIGIAGYVRSFIGISPISVDGLWATIQADEGTNPIFQLDFTRLIYALDILMCIQEITIDNNGLIHKSIVNSNRTEHDHEEN